jgi:hypothetical protein
VRYASVENVPLTAASMDLRGTFPNDLKYGLAEGASSAMEELTYTLAVESAAPREDVLRIVRRAGANCHAEQSLRNPVPVIPRLKLNGEEVVLGEDG